MDAFILSAVRTPIGKFLGGLADVPAPQLGAVAIAEALKRAERPARSGRRSDHGQRRAGRASARPRRGRRRSLRGLPDTIAAHTANKVCGSGLKAVMLAAQAIRAGDAELIVAGGMESMSRAPFLLQGVRQGYKYGDQKTVDALIHDGLWCAFENWAMGEAAEHIAAKCAVSRGGPGPLLGPEPPARRGGVGGRRVRGRGRAGHVPGERDEADRDGRATDEGIRPDTTAEGLAKLRPAFRAGRHGDGRATPRNSRDGAAAVVVASGRFVEQSRGEAAGADRRLRDERGSPEGHLHRPGAGGEGGAGEGEAVAQDIDLFELNEAFAAQMLACGKELELDEAKVNVHGGAVALGHPIGASGARVLTTLVHALHRHGKR